MTVTIPAQATGTHRIEYIRIDYLNEHRAPRNPKLHSDEIGNSIGRFGFVSPAMLDERTGLLVSGHGRLDELLRMRSNGANPPAGIEIAPDGMWCMPVVRGVAFNSDAEAEAFSLADNRLTEAGGWDITMLATMLSEHSQQPGGLTGLGWTEDDVADLLAQAVSEAEPENPPEDAEPRIGEGPELQKKWETALGQLWEVPSLTLPGECHRLVCGDATDPRDFEQLMGTVRATICVTDPPYNIDYEGHVGSPRRRITNDALGVDYANFCRQFMLHVKGYTQPGAALYLAFAGQEWPVVDQQVRAAGFHWSSTIIWYKDSMVMGRRDYQSQYEPLWYGWNDAAPRLYPLEDDRTQTDVWQIDRPKRSEEFPIMKPVELMEKALANSSAMGDDCLDPFLGSGSTLVSCERKGRRCFGMEIDPETLAIALQRFEDIGMHPRLVARGAP